MTTTFSGHVLITKGNLKELPKLLQKKGSGLLVSNLNGFPGGPFLMDLFLNPKVDVEKLHIYPPSRRIDLVDRHYRLTKKSRRADPLRSFFEAIEVGECAFEIGYQGSVMRGFSLDEPMLYIESQQYVSAALTFLLANEPTVRTLNLSDDDFKRIEAYVEEDLKTKEALKKNIDAGQVADSLLGIF